MRNMHVLIMAFDSSGFKLFNIFALQLQFLLFLSLDAWSMKQQKQKKGK